MNDGEQTIKLDIGGMRLADTRRPVLVVLQGTSLGMTLNLEAERIVLGRGSAADFILRDSIASRLHAEILRISTPDGFTEFYLNDLSSTNGTFLNGHRITSSQLLQDGDKINIGSHMLKFAMLDEFEAEFQEQVHRMTRYDELTGLMSRRSLFAELDRIVAHESKSRAPRAISVLMMDLDFFKRVNDGRGHLVGSQTIREVGKMIRDGLGNTELAARYGGEEFLAYLYGNAEKGFELAEKIRTAVESHPFAASATDPSQKMNVTISLGVSVFPGDGTRALDLVQKADQALYRAKQTGRNRTCVFDSRLDNCGSTRLEGDVSAIIYGPADAQ